MSRRTDRGSGVISTTMGIAVFLTLLLLAAHVLLDLWASSEVRAAATRAATDVALADHDGADVRAAALDRAREELGRFGAGATFDFDGTTGSNVVVHARVRGVGLMPVLDQLIPSLAELDERVVVPRETP